MPHVPEGDPGVRVGETVGIGGDEVGGALEDDLQRPARRHACRELLPRHRELERALGRQRLVEDAHLLLAAKLAEADVEAAERIVAAEHIVIVHVEPQPLRDHVLERHVLKVELEAPRGIQRPFDHVRLLPLATELSDDVRIAQAVGVGCH